MRQDNEEELEVELEYSLGFGFREMARLFGTHRSRLNIGT